MMMHAVELLYKRGELEAPFRLAKLLGGAVQALARRSPAHRGGVLRELGGQILVLIDLLNRHP